MMGGAARTLFAFAVGWSLVAVLPGAVFRGFLSIAPELAEKTPRFPAEVAVGIGLVFAAAGARSLLRPPASETAWRRGAEGEMSVGRKLESLRLEGLHVVHDVPLPGSRANIDHLVVSPHGVLAVETKAYRGRLALRNRRQELWIGGRNRSQLLDQALRQAEAVRLRLAAAGLGHVLVTPVLCFVGTQLPRWSPRSARGVSLTSLRRLRQVLVPDEGPSVEPGDVDAVVALFDTAGDQPASAEPTETASLPPSGDPRCARCGKPLVERKRRSDGARFYGCSGFPKCRYTRPLEGTRR